MLRDRFGDGSIRVWNSHAKFAIFTGSKSADALYLTSANFNKNNNVESFTYHFGGPIAGEYLALVEDLFAAQNNGEGFVDQVKARRHTEEILGPVRSPKVRIKKARIVRWNPGKD